ncbi:reverse transcriptase domain-containing protein [Tanacetum coccineum]
MLVQPTQAEGASSERLSDAQPSPSPAPTSEVPNESLPDSTSAQPSEVPFEQQPDPSPSPSPRPSPQPSPTPTIPDSIPEPSGENHEDHSSNDTSLSGNEDEMTLQNVYDLCISLCQQVTDQAKEIQLLKAKITKLKKQAKPVIKHFKAYLKTVSLQKRIPKKSSSKKQRMHKKNVSKQGRKITKGESSVQRDPMFDVMPEDNIDHMEADNAQSEGRTKELVDEDKELDEDRLSTEDKVSTDFEKVSTDKPLVSTDGSKALYNNDPLPSPNQGDYSPEIQKDLKVVEPQKSLLEHATSYEPKVELPKSNLKSYLRISNPEFCSHKILLEDDYEPSVQHQRRVNPKIHDVIKKEVEKLLDAGLIYPISDSPWVSPVHCVPKKGGMTVVTNEENELVPTRLVTGWRVCIDYRKLNEATCKDHFPLPFMDQMLERLAGNEFYCFLDGFSGYFQIPIDPKDQEKTTFTCPYGTFAYRRMPFGLCNAPGTFQRCMMAIFHDMIEKTMEVFMDDFSVFGDSFSSCLANLDKMLKRCEDTKLALNWEKSHFMVKEGIVLGHKISRKGIEVDKAKVDVISKLPHPTTVKGIRSFLGHAGFYRRFIKDFSKISRPMTHLLEKNTPFIFSEDCILAFQTLKKKLTEAPILIAPNWDQPFEIMCDASDYAIGAVLG